MIQTCLLNLDILQLSSITVSSPNKGHELCSFQMYDSYGHTWAQGGRKNQLIKCTSGKQKQLESGKKYLLEEAIAKAQNAHSFDNYQYVITQIYRVCDTVKFN